MRFETIAVVAAISTEAAVEGENTLSFQLSGRKESIEAILGPRNGGFFGEDKALSNDRVVGNEATNIIQSKDARGTAEADIGVLASEQNAHRSLKTYTVADLPIGYNKEWYEKIEEICPYPLLFIGRSATLEAMSRPLAHIVEFYCSQYGACNTCEVANLYEGGTISGYTISMDCSDSSKDFLSPLFDACDGLGLGFGIQYDQELCASCDVDVETNSVTMRDCHIANIGYDIDTVLYNKGYSEFYVDTQFFLKDPIVELGNDSCYFYYYDCSFCGFTFVSDPETGMESYNFAIDCTNTDANFSFEEISFGKCQCGVCASCNIDADKQLLEFFDCSISRATEEFYEAIIAIMDSPPSADGEFDEDQTNNPEEEDKGLDEELANEDLDGEIDDEETNATPEEDLDASDLRYVELAYSIEYFLPNKKIPRQSDYSELSQATGAYLKRFMLAIYSFSAQENLVDFDTKIISNTILCVYMPIIEFLVLPQSDHSCISRSLFFSKCSVQNHGMKKNRSSGDTSRVSVQFISRAAFGNDSVTIPTPGNVFSVLEKTNPQSYLDELTVELPESNIFDSTTAINYDFPQFLVPPTPPPTDALATIAPTISNGKETSVDSSACRNTTPSIAVLMAMVASCMTVAWWHQ
jgi:hypothetical protein